MSNIIKYLGELALASRLKMLSESLMQDVRKIYKEQNLDFEPRWFLAFYQLSKKTPMAITELAEAIGVTHPAVNQIANEMITAGIIEANIDTKDKRKRLLTISEKGTELLIDIKPVWETIELANMELINNTFCDFLKSIEKIELALEEKSMYTRVIEKIKLNIDENLKIIGYNPELNEYFKTINYEWLQKYFTIEASDIEVLSNPEEKIIKQGGEILFAQINGETVGTCALINHGNGLFELAKMGVIQKYQGKQIGKKLATAIIEKARALQAKEVFLITHENLAKAINLYKSLGFQKVNPIKEIQYERCGISMKLELK